jgi:hypothetical protein
MPTFDFTLAQITELSPAECADLVKIYGLTDPYSGDQQLGNLQEPAYRCLVRSWRAK